MDTAHKIIRVSCKSAGTINIDQLVDFQGTFKGMDEQSKAKLRKHIIEDGFIDPVSVWENPADAKIMILNGHQRIMVMRELRADGWTIPQIPVNYVNATSYLEAKNFLLSLASQYGRISGDGLRDFILDMNVDLSYISDNFNLPDFVFPMEIGLENNAMPQNLTGLTITPDSTETPKDLVTGVRKTTQVDDLQKFLSNEMRNMVFTYAKSDFEKMLGYIDKIKAITGQSNASDAMVTFLGEKLA